MTRGAPRRSFGLCIELIVTDYLMPGTRGTELIDKARQLRPEMKAVLITGYARLAAEQPGSPSPSAHPTSPAKWRGCCRRKWSNYQRDGRAAKPERRHRGRTHPPDELLKGMVGKRLTYRRTAALAA